MRLSRYWSADPAPLRLTLGGYPRMDDGHPPVGLCDSSWSFWAWTGLAQAKFWILSRLLRLCGQGHFATRLWNGWQVSFWCSAQPLELHVPRVQLAPSCWVIRLR